jgi:hypothetical protein
MLMAILIMAAAAVLAASGCGGGKTPETGSSDEASPAPAAAASFDAAGSDPQAIAVADRVLAAMGGAEAWAGTRALVFTFAVARGDTELTRRTHYWDRARGWHRVEGVDHAQRSFVIIHDLADSTVSLAVIDGQPVEDAAERRRLKAAAHAMWVNDTYWLLMPFKLKDPGVHLAYMDVETFNGRPMDVIQVSFDQVGLTPGDHYWAYVNQETGLMERWAFRLESMPPDAPPKAFRWINWQRYGKILLSDAKTAVEGDQRIFFPDLAVFDELPESVFTSTAAVSVPAL